MMTRLMRHIFITVVLVAACHGSDPAKGGAGSASSAPTTTPSAMPAPATGSATVVVPPAGSGDVAGSATAAPTKPPVPTKVDSQDAHPAESLPLEGHDFTPEGRALFAVGACGDIPPPAGFPAKLLEKHCD